MNKEEILEGNKLIASFMDIDDSMPHDRQGAYLYHSSWDWLMPVVEKIESIYYISIYITKSYLGKHRVEISYEPSAHNKNNKNKTIFIQNDNKIECVYDAVIKFIKCHNQSKLNESN